MKNKTYAVPENFSLVKLGGGVDSLSAPVAAILPEGGAA